MVLVLMNWKKPWKKSYNFNIKGLTDLFKVKDVYTMKLDLNAFEEDKSEPDMKDGNNT